MATVDTGDTAHRIGLAYRLAALTMRTSSSAIASRSTIGKLQSVLHLPGFPQMTANTFLKFTFWTSAAAVLVLSLAPTTAELPTTGWDKSNHFIGFFALAVFGLRGHPKHSMALIAGLAMFGGLIEILQSFTTYRRAEWADWIADDIGVMAGYALCWALPRIAPAKPDDARLAP